MSISEHKLNRRDLVRLGVCGLSGLSLVDLGCAPGDMNLASRAPELPNVVIIMADDLGYGDVGCYGSGTIRTPNIDSLASGGLKFTDYHANAPVCSPTRAAMLTGRYQQRCGVDEVVYAKGPSRHTGMASDEVTFAELLRKRGYVTGIFGKWHLGYDVRFNPTKQGFDEFRGYVSGNVDYHSHIDGAGIADWWANCQKLPEDGYVTDLITKHAADFIRRHKTEPFCLYIPHEAPHYPYQGRGDPPQRLHDGQVTDRARGPEIRRAYKEMVEAMDEGVGRIIDTLRLLKLDRRTFLFFCSDNGANRNGSNGPLAGQKGSLLEGGHRVPAVAYWPGKIKDGTTTDETVLGMDLFPTVVSLAGVKLPAALELDGVNLLSTLTQGKRLPKRTVFWAYRKQRASRKGPWKLLVRGNRTGLYNLDRDLGEKDDLAQAKPEIVKSLRAELSAWERDVSYGPGQKA